MQVRAGRLAGHANLAYYIALTQHVTHLHINNAQMRIKRMGANRRIPNPPGVPIAALIPTGVHDLTGGDTKHRRTLRRCKVNAVMRLLTKHLLIVCWVLAKALAHRPPHHRPDQPASRWCWYGKGRLSFA